MNEVEFKIIGVEKGTCSLTSEEGEKWDVNDLPDAPVEKRVIEMPADEIKLLVENKRGRSIFGFLHYLINETGGPSLITELTDELEAANTSITQDVLAEWYLGHVEFVPKKEQLFYVVAEMIVDDNYVYKDESEILFVNDGLATKFTEMEADEIVSGMDVLKARKVKVEK